MSGHRGQSKALERQKRKRAELKKKHAAAQHALRPAALLKRASDFPIHRAYLSSAWRESDEYMPGLVSAVITRRAPGGLLVGTALIDRTCFGVKDAHATKMTELEFDEYLSQLQEHHSMEQAEPSTCLSVVHHAIDYARSLGFAPHSDFVPEMFEPRPEPLEDTPLSKPSRPFFAAGPYDNIPLVMARLRAAVGDDFRFMVPSPDGETMSKPLDAKDTMRMLEAWRKTMQVEELIEQEKHDEAESVCESLLGDENVQEHAAMELMARVREARGDLPGAMDWMRKAIEAADGEAEEHELAGMEQQLQRLAAQQP